MLPITRARQMTAKLGEFLGINNVADPLVGTPAERGQKTWQWQSVADNVDLTDNNNFVRRSGYKLMRSGAMITSSFSTFDFSRTYIIDSGNLLDLRSDGTAVLLYSGLTGKVYWTEINNTVYLACDQKLTVDQNGVVNKWNLDSPTGFVVSSSSGNLQAGVYRVILTYVDFDGREGPGSIEVDVYVSNGGGITISNIPTEHDAAIYIASDTVFQLATVQRGGAFTYAGGELGVELTTANHSAVPDKSGPIAAYGASIYCAEYIQEAHMSVVWVSEPMGFHLFNMSENFLTFPGEIVFMADCTQGLVIGSTQKIYLYDGVNLTVLAEYGSMLGQHYDIGPDKKLYFWTKRGLCSAMPFDNLMENTVSVPSGAYAAGGIINRDGYVSYLSVLQTGNKPFNVRKPK